MDAQGQNADISWHVVNTGESDEGMGCNDGQNCNDGLGISRSPATLLQVSLGFSQPDANLELFFQHIE